MTSEPSSGADTPLNGAQKRHGESLDTDRPRQIPRQSGPEPAAPGAPATPAKPEASELVGAVGEAGPGPQTARRRSLGPVPQPSPSVFHRIMEERQQQSGTQASDIGSFSSPPEGAQPPEPRGILTVVDGEEAYVAPDSDSDSTQSQTQSQPTACAFAGCGESFGSPHELAEHIRGHADAIAPAPTGTTDQVSQLEERIAAQEATLRSRDLELGRLQAHVAELERDPPEVVQILSQSTQGEAGEEILALKKKLKSSVLALKSARSDLSFFREQYDVASTSAVKEVQRAEKAEAQAARLKEQLSLGLKQRSLHFSSTLKAHAAGAEKAQYQLQLLLGQSRRTDDKIRHRAAQHERLVKENRKYETELHEARSRADTLQKRNNDLLDQVATLRGRLMGAFDSVEGSSDSDAEAGERSAFTRESEFGDSKQRLAMPALSAPPSECRPLTPVVQDVMLAAPAGSTAAPTNELMFKCKWDACAAIFVDRQELETHALGHVQTELDQ